MLNFSCPEEQHWDSQFKRQAFGFFQTWFWWTTAHGWREKMENKPSKPIMPSGIYNEDIATIISKQSISNCMEDGSHSFAMEIL